jgi:hypothetical protein
MFEKTKKRIDTQINDRIVAPSRTAVVFSITALILSALALTVAVSYANR